MRKNGSWLAVSVTVIAICCATTTHAQLIVNETNNVGQSAGNNLLQTDFPDKPYEGFDYGTVIPHSGNNNDPLNGDPPGNPYPADIDSAAGTQTELPNGWTLAGGVGWGRIEGNGGDWIELVVTEDHADLRGYTLYWENNDTLTLPSPEGIGHTADDRGAIKFTQDAVWSDLRAGSIITISELDSVDEISDGFTTGPAYSNIHDTGHNYDLSTDTSYDPFAGDWHMHFHLDESITNEGSATQYFESESDIKVDNDDWRMAIFDATNTTLTPEFVESNVLRPALDLTTGLVHGFIGEAAEGWDSGGVNNEEATTLLADPVSGISNANYEDTDFSSFGSPNLYNANSESTLDGVQDFSALRDPVLASGGTPEDLNNDGFVDGLDLGILLGNFDQATTPDGGELDGNAPVDGLDLGILLGAWNPPAANAAISAVPEPSTALLLGTALLATGIRGRFRR